MQTALQFSDQQWLKFLHFIKMYLAMEEWFHDCWTSWDIQGWERNNRQMPREGLISSNTRQIEE